MTEQTYSMDGQFVSAVSDNQQAAKNGFRVAAASRGDVDNMSTLASLQAELTEMSKSIASEPQWLEQCARRLANRTHATWIALQRTKLQGSREEPVQLTLFGTAADSHAFMDSCCHATTQALTTGTSVVLRVPSIPATCVIAVPVPGANGECIQALQPAPISTPELTLAAFQLAASNLATWHAERRAQASNAEASELAALIELVSQVESCEDPNHAFRVLADRLQQYMTCEEVIVGLYDSPAASCDVVSISDSPTVDARAEKTRLAQAVLQECIARGNLSCWPARQRNDRHALCAHRQFAEAVGAAAMTSVVLRDELGRVRGAWLMWGELNSVQGPKSLNFALAAQRPLASSLGLQRRARRHPWHQAAACCVDSLRQKQKKTILVIVAVVLAGLMLPVRYRVTGSCELQPVARRFVAAPFDGQLEETLVEPGDVVTQNQVLARMDERELHWELAGAEAELHRARKEHAGHLATHESGKTQIADDEVKRITMRTELLRHRLENLKILSPIDGIVVTGDLSKSVGMPLTTGQSLFEIAPLDQMIVEIAVPEDDVRLVAQGMPVHIWLDAFPGRRWDVRLQRIHPRSELKNHKNVFIAEVELPNIHTEFRPGMRGSARIATVKSPLAWNLFHKAAASVIRWLGW